MSWFGRSANPKDREDRRTEQVAARLEAVASRLERFTNALEAQLNAEEAMGVERRGDRGDPRSP